MSTCPKHMLLLSANEESMAFLATHVLFALLLCNFRLLLRRALECYSNEYVPIAYADAICE